MRVKLARVLNSLCAQLGVVDVTAAVVCGLPLVAEVGSESAQLPFIVE